MPATDQTHLDCNQMSPDMTQLGRNIVPMAGTGETKVTTTAKPLADPMPWRVVGWMFRDGECVAIERQNDEPASSARSE